MTAHNANPPINAMSYWSQARAAVQEMQGSLLVLLWMLSCIPQICRHDHARPYRKRRCFIGSSSSRYQGETIISRGPARTSLKSSRRRRRQVVKVQAGLLRQEVVQIVLTAHSPRIPLLGHQMAVPVQAWYAVRLWSAQSQARLGLVRSLRLSIKPRVSDCMC
jgi:hypothetical protein